MDKYSLILLMMIISIAGGMAIYDNNKDKIEIPDSKWKTNDDGIYYFNTCIEGNKFIVTRSTQNYKQLAGPVGECNKKE